MRRILFIAVMLLAAGSVLFLFGLTVWSPGAGMNKGNASVDGVSASALEKPTVSFGNPSLGPKEAKVAMFVFGDYQCEACADFEAALKQIRIDFPNDVRLIWKDMPNSDAHAEAINAAVAARCAGEQGAFWPYHDLLMSQRGAILPANYTPYAIQLGLNLESFGGCYDNLQTKPLVQRDFDEGQRLRVNATPYVFIGERRIDGAVSAEQLKSFVESALRQQ